MKKYTCIICGKVKKQPAIKVRSGRAKFCSHKCKGVYQKEYYRGADNPFYGRKHTPETIDRIKANARVLMGDKHPRWKGGVCGKYWAKKCLIRDDYTCQICRLRDREIMQVDHILPKRSHSELKFVLKNLRTICPNCHERKSRHEKSKNYVN